MRHTLTSLRNTSTLRRLKSAHLLLVATFVLLASVGFVTLLDGHTAAFMTPSLGTAQSFGVLGAATVTNTGPTSVSGDLGVWPGTAVTGFPPGIVTNGVIHANDAVAQQAQSDVTVAYNSLAGMPCNTNLTGQDLGGLTLAPGVYCFNTSAQLTGTLRLDAQGDPNAVFIFQIGSTLVTASNAAVLTINSAQDCSAYWQVGSSATLGTGTSFIGSILALASITMNTNATLSGRALARTGAVTMDSNIVTRTACAPTLAKAFTPPTIIVNGISTLTITLSNPNTIAANLTAPFTDNLPAGVTIAAPPNAANTCGGVVTATAGSNAVTLTGGMIPAGNGLIPGACTITVNVTGALPGGYLNTIPIGALQTSNGSNLTPATATLTVICPVIVATITAPAAVCALSPGNAASVPNAGAGATYDWTITNGTITGGQGTPNLTFTAGTTGPVALNVTVTTSPGCSADGAAQVIINPNPTAATGPPQALCESVPGPTVFSLNGTVANGTPQWSVFGSTGTAAANIVSPNSAITNVNVTGNGTVTLRLTATSAATPSCGMASADVVLTVNANPAAAAGVDQTLCQLVPGPTVFNVTGTATNGIPTWNVLATTGTAAATIVSPNNATTAVNVTGAGTVTLRLTSTSANCGAVTDDVVLTILPAPLANAGIDQASCQTIPGPTAFTVTGNTANGTPATPAWTLVGATGTAVPVILTPNNAATGVNITGIGTVTLRFTVNSNSVPNCGTSFEDVVLTVTTNAIALAGPDQALCQMVPGPTVFTVNGTGGTPSWSVIASTGSAAAIIVAPNSAATNVNVTGLGTVTLRLTTSSPGCGNTTDDVVLTVNPNPAAAAGPDQMLCQVVPGPTVFSVTGTLANGTPQWSVVGSTGTALANIVTPNNATTNVNVTGNGSVTLRLTATSNATPSCGTAADDVVLSINASPTAAAGVDQALCQLVPGPTVFTVTGTVSSGTPQWSVLSTTGTALANIVSPNNATTNVNVTGNGTVTLRLTVTSNATPNCGLSVDDVILTVNANAAAAAGLDQTLCQTVPGPTVFNVTGTATNGTPAWSVLSTTGTATAIIVSPNNATTAVNVTGNGSVTLRLTTTSNLTPSCGAATDDVLLTVLPAPLANAGIDQAICETMPGPTVFTVSGAATNGTPATPAWTLIGTTGTAVPVILTPNNTTTGVNITGSGTVTLRFTVNSNSVPNCGTAFDEVVLTVTAGAVALAGPDQALCQTLPGPTVFTINGAGGPPTWSVFATTGTALATIVSPNSATTNVNVTGLGTITLRLTTTSPNCGTATDDVVLTVNASPTAAAGPDQALCQVLPGPTAFTVTGTFTNGLPATPAWTVVTSTGTALATILNPNAATTGVNLTGAGTVTLRFTVNSNAIPACGPAADDVVLSVNANALAAAGVDQTLCQVVPGPTVFTVTGTVSGGTPQWSVLGATGTALATLVTPNNATTNVNVSGNGTVTLRLTVTSNTTPICGTATDDVVLTINANPAAAAGPDQMLCQTVPGPTVFTVTGTVSGGTPQWSVFATTGTATAIIVSPNSTTTNVNVSGTGTVTMRMIVTSNATPSCSVVTDDVVLTANPSPVTAITVATPVCGLSTSNTASVPDAGAGATYLWTITNGTITSGQGTRNITWTAGAVSPVTLNVTVTTLPGCSASGSAQITVNQNPIAAALAPQTLCQTLPGPTVFTLNGTVANGTPQWGVLTSTGTAAATIVTPNSATTNVNVTGSGTVTLRLTATSNAIPACNAVTSDVVLTVNPLPVSTITALATVCALTPGNTAAVPDAGAGATYLWTITGGTLTAGQGTRSITYTAGNTGNVTLTVTVTTAAGCSTNSTKLVTVDSTCGVDVCIVKTGSALVAIENNQFTYTLSVVNFGPGLATGVTVTDTLQAGITLVSATPSQGTCSGTTTLICNLGNLANQATATIRLVVTFPMKSAGSVICNTATITSNQIEIGPANNTSTVCVPVEKVPPGPGLNLPPTSQVSDQKAGSVLVFPYYTSDATNPNRANTRICLTNVENNWQACVHLFFVDGATCSVADANLCLTPNQTACFLMSDLDPGTSGYLVAVLVDCLTGCPLNINTLIGDEFIKLASGHTANVGAEAIAGLPGAKALCDVNSSTAELKFDGVMYNQLPRVLALDNLGSRLDGNDTVLILNRIGGNLATGAATIGSLFGLLYNDAEQGYSFTFTAGCQFRGSLTDSFPRTVPRLTTIIPAGRSGWLKLWGASDIGLFGVALNFNPNAAANSGAFNGGHTLHKLTLTPNASLTIPIFPPAC